MKSFQVLHGDFLLAKLKFSVENSDHSLTGIMKGCMYDNQRWVHLHEFHSTLAFAWRWWKLWWWDEDEVTPYTLIIVCHHMHLVLSVLRVHRQTESDRMKIRKILYPILVVLIRKIEPKQNQNRMILALNFRSD